MASSKRTTKKTGGKKTKATRKRKRLKLSRAEKAYFALMMAYNPAFRKQLRANPRQALKSLGIKIPAGIRIPKPKRLPGRAKAEARLREFGTQSLDEQDASFDRNCPDAPGS